MRWCPPGSRKACSSPAPIHRSTVVLLTPQCLAINPTEMNSGFNGAIVFNMIASLSPHRRFIYCCFLKVCRVFRRKQRSRLDVSGSARSADGRQPDCLFQSISRRLLYSRRSVWQRFQWLGIGGSKFLFLCSNNSSFAR